MINNDELLFVVDENNTPIDPKPRKEVHAKGYWHRTSQVWIINNKKEILCQQRSLLKDTSPGNWDPYHGGHFGPGISYEDGAITELKEELKIHAKKEDLKLFKIHKSHTHIEFQAAFVYIWNGNIKKITFEKDEVEQIKWYSIPEIRRLALEERGNKWSNIEYLEEILDWLEKPDIMKKYRTEIKN